MDSSSRYTEEEMNLLAHTPHFIGAAMAIAGNSGLFGTGKEMFTSAKSIMSGIKEYPNNALIQSVLPRLTESASDAMEKIKSLRNWGRDRLQAKGVNSVEAYKNAALEDVESVAYLLAAKSSGQEADEYKQWALSIAEKVAMATTEGSFLGFGGERFSENEKLFFNQLENAFNIKSRLTSNEYASISL